MCAVMRSMDGPERRFNIHACQGEPLLAALEELDLAREPLAVNGSSISSGNANELR